VKQVTINPVLLDPVVSGKFSKAGEADGHGMRVMRNHRILGEDAHHDQEAR
jgi:hypothetical protein